MNAARKATLGILSDIHYASPAERARGDKYETGVIANPLLRLAVQWEQRYIWLREPFGQNHLLDRFIEEMKSADYVVANGDYSCNTAFVGVSDDAAFESARECLEKLRSAFAPKFKAVFGDHELGKMSMFGERGGMRLASWGRACGELGLEPFWQLELGRYALLGVVSSLVALPVYEYDTLVPERPKWEALRSEHMRAIVEAFGSLRREQRVILFCHDPTALPFLWREEAVRAKAAQIEQTIIGHLHSNLVYTKSRILAGMPVIRFLGYTAQRMTGGLNEARHWRHFNVRLCPALAGIELLKDGGYLTAELDLEGTEPARFTLHRLPRS